MYNKKSEAKHKTGLGICKEAFGVDSWIYGYFDVLIYFRIYTLILIIRPALIALAFLEQRKRPNISEPQMSLHTER